MEFAVLQKTGPSQEVEVTKYTTPYTQRCPFVKLFRSVKAKGNKTNEGRGLLSTQNGRLWRLSLDSFLVGLVDLFVFCLVGWLFYFLFDLFLRQDFSVLQSWLS